MEGHPRLWLVHIHHAGGEDYSIRSTELGVDASVRDWCLSWWHEVAELNPDVADPGRLSTADLIARYFGRHPHEQLVVTPLQLDESFRIANVLGQLDGPGRIH